MKLIIPMLAAAVVSTTAHADTSDHHNDLRLDTSLQASTEFGAQGPDDAMAKAPRTARITVTFSTSGKGGKGYPYANPYGVGPHNDSR